MCRDNPTLGAPRIHGELLSLGIDVGESSVSKYMVRSRKPASQTWRTFLENHTQQLVSIDFFTVPTIHFQVLYVFLVLAHDRRRILHFNVTAHPSAEWTAQQLREAFPFAQLPRYLLRDRDRIFGDEFPAINRLIVAEENVPVERRYSFPVELFTPQVKAPPSSSDLWKGQRRERDPPRHHTRYPPFPCASIPQ